MPIVPAVCPNCGGFLEVDKEHEAAKCPHCGCPFLIENAINYYYTINKSNGGEASSSGDSIDKRFKAAESLLELENYSAAYDIYQELIEVAPQDYRVWFGLIMSVSHKLTKQYEDYEELKLNDIQKYIGSLEKTISVEKNNLVFECKSYLNSERNRIKRNAKLWELEKRKRELSSALSLNKSNYESLISHRPQYFHGIGDLWYLVALGVVILICGLLGLKAYASPMYGLIAIIIGLILSIIGFMKVSRIVKNNKSGWEKNVKEAEGCVSDIKAELSDIEKEIERIRI